MTLIDVCPSIPVLVPTVLGGRPLNADLPAFHGPVVDLRAFSSLLSVVCV